MFNKMKRLKNLLTSAQDTDILLFMSQLGLLVPGVDFLTEC